MSHQLHYKPKIKFITWVDHIIDPFCGIGCTGAAALINGRNFIGMEYNESRAAVCERALNQLMEIVN